MSDEQAAVAYAEAVRQKFSIGEAREHTYRPAFERFIESLGDFDAANDQARSEYGNPDFVFRKASNLNILLGYAETKDITITDLDKVAKSEQLQRYAGYKKLFLTNYLEFRFYANGEEYEHVTIGKLHGNTIEFDQREFARLSHIIREFLNEGAVPIKSGKRLAAIMGQHARRIRDNVTRYLEQENEKNQDLEAIYDLMRKELVHDLSEEKFADMYAQTLVYGLFSARYSDTTPDDFSRREASELVPASNPFLRQFFGHIGGVNFDKRLAFIVDDLCEVFAVSDVQRLVEKHLRLFEVENDKDPIIHFYEDFLQAYDPAIRKAMGAYYTPVPVVRYIIRQVDKILREDFGLSGGLADTTKITKEIEVGQDMRHDRRLKAKTTQPKTLHKVQVLDPAVGTATFLNETVKFIAKQFEGQEGRWEQYVNDDLLPRLSGFELMMAPYTIAHLKLAMTLQETGAHHLRERLGVYLTNTLEEGIAQGQQNLFNVGLQAAVTEESKLASEVKHDRPVMIVMGNPPYSVSSNNKSAYIQNLIKDYKRDLNERKINLDDDYIKFIRFAEEMIAKNGSGIVAMITNNSYIDGVTHRQMRKHLLQTFDKIYVLDLHGNSKKRETAPDGGKDENVFNIMQGVAIVLMVKVNETTSDLGQAFHAGLWGSRAEKFRALRMDDLSPVPIDLTEPYYFFTPKKDEGAQEYNTGVSLNELFINKSSGFRSGADSAQICWTAQEIETVVADLIDLPEQTYREKYGLKDGRNHNYEGMRKDVGSVVDVGRIVKTLYRPFDIRYTYYSKKSSGFVARPRNQTMQNFLSGSTNIGLIYKRGYIEEKAAPGFVTEFISGERTWSRPGMQGADTVAPLYVYHDGGTHDPNFDPGELKRLTANLPARPSPEDVLDYIYAVLYSPSYRTKYKEFLKTDFPRVPIPTQAEFNHLAPLGQQLRELHLMKSPSLQQLDTIFPVAGYAEVEQIRYDGGKVWINDTQYFGNVPELAWSFYIGGYQPAQKWLKDRKGRKLTNEDLVHYQRIIKTLIETDKIMHQIDKD